MIPPNISNGQSVVLDLAAGRVFRLRKSVMTAARLINDRTSIPANNPHGWRYRPFMITLTYRDGVEWRSEHISKFLDAMQAWAVRQTGSRFPYLWVMELTKKGRPHFHVLIWAPARLTIPKPDKRGWWKHGSRSAGSRVERVRNSVGYVAKYASKFASKDAEFPPNARIHGVGGITAWERRVVAWWKMPKDLRDDKGEGVNLWHRCPGGGWYNRSTHERILSQWKIDFFSPGGKYVRIVQCAPDEDGANYRSHFGFVREMYMRDMGRKVAGTVRPFNLREDMGEATKEQWIDSVMRLDDLRREDWQAQLEKDRVWWIAHVERVVGLSPDA